MTNTYSQQLEEAVRSGLPWSKLSGCNILVTGATGLIGGCLVDMLMHRRHRDYTVYAAGRNKARADRRFSTYLNDPDFHFLCFDVTKPLPADVDFHFIIDAASSASPALYAADPVGVMKANICGVDRLLDYGRRHRLRRFVYVSSGEVYGEGDGRIFTEDYSGYVDPTAVRSCYPSSKRAAETLAVCYARQYGLDISIARPSHVYGPYFSPSDNRVYAQFLRNVLAGEDIVMKSEGTQFRSWCYVIDCAAALLFLLLKGENMTAYNIADAQANITIRQLAEMIAAVGNRKVVMELPEEAEKAGYSVVTRAVFDTTRLEQLGWMPLPSSMQEKIKATLLEEKRVQGGSCL